MGHAAPPSPSPDEPMDAADAAAISHAEFAPIKLGELRDGVAAGNAVVVAAADHHGVCVYIVRHYFVHCDITCLR